VIDPQSPSLKLVGAVLNGRWRLVRLLGEGGMGAVYEAEGLRGEGRRAVKMLHPEFTKEESVLSRFFAEAQASQQLNHPHVARVFESARAEDGTPYLVMELLQGKSLGEVLETGKIYPPHEAAPLVHAVLQALALAHSQRIVHRDLKPDNLFLVNDASGRPTIKVLDFGIAKVMDAAGGMGSKTRTGVLLGTPGYMSPEQIKNSKGVDPRSDLWSVAVIFYEMLTGKSPFPADNEFAKLTAVLTDPVRPIEQVAPNLGAWSQFFQRGLSKELPTRFQSAAEMAQALTAVTGAGRSASVSPPSMQAPMTSAQQNAGTQMLPSFASPPTYQGAGQGAGQGAPAKNIAATMSLDASELPQNLAPAQKPPSLAPPAGARAPGATHVSGERPPGLPSSPSHSPNIAVVQAPPLAKGVPVWVVVVVGAVCLGLGFVVGMVVG
jgi:serine/threonine protein kinase